MAIKKSSFAAAAASGIGAVAALGAANDANAVSLRYQSTDFLSNFATKPMSTAAGFSINGVNSAGVSTGYGYRSGNTVYAMMYSLSGSMYARAYARCYSSSQNVYSAVYSDWSNTQTYKSIGCSNLPSGAGPWSTVGWGVAMMSWADSSIPGSTRKMCDGVGCGAPDSMKVGSSFLSQYPALTGGANGTEGIGGLPSGGVNVSVSGPGTVIMVDGAW